MEFAWLAKREFPFNNKYYCFRCGAFLSLCVAVMAVFFAIAQYRLKRSIKISAAYGTSQTAGFSNAYVSSVIIKNLKDKSEAIFGVYVRLGSNLYVELEEFDDSPLIIGPFETVVRSYNPVTYYGCGPYKVDINKALNRCRSNSRVVLSTSKGKYVTRKNKKYWKPVIESLRNANVAALQCVQVEDERPDGKRYVIPNAAQYIVRFSQKGESKSYYVYQSGYMFSHNMRFFRLEEHHLEDRDKLLEHLKSLENLEEEGVDVSTIVVESVEDFSEMQRMNEFYNKSAKVDPSGWFRTKVLGKLFYFIEKYRIKRINHDRGRKGISYNKKIALKVGVLLFFVSLCAFYLWVSFPDIYFFQNGF